MAIFDWSKVANAIAVAPKETEPQPVIKLQLQRPESGILGAPSQEELQTAARVQVLLGATGGVVAVTGVADNDGATLLASCLGSGLAATSGSDVLLIDANVQSPVIHEVFRVPIKPGLLEVLEEEIGVEKAAHPQELSNLFVLPLGQSTSTLAALLSKPVCTNILDGMRNRYRYIVIDTGLVRAHADGVLLAARSDGVVAAAAAGVRRRHELRQLQQELKTLRIPLLGVVLTKEV